MPDDVDTPDTAIVVVGGDPPPATLARHLPRHGLVIAADSGYDHAIALGLAPHILIGDLDSISEKGRLDARGRGIDVREHPADKDATDTELAVRTAAALGVDRITVVSGGGGRLDHLLASILVLTHDALDATRWCDAWIGEAHVVMLRGPRDLTLSRAIAPPSGDAALGADIVSVLAPAGPARGVSISGVRWPLSDATIVPGSSWGLSNEMISSSLSVSVTDGVLAVVFPYAVDGAPTEMEIR